MTIPRPTGEYKDRMTVAPAWPEADEDAHSRRSSELSSTQTQLIGQVAAWLQLQTKLFDGHTWQGKAFEAGRTKVVNVYKSMKSTAEMLKSAVAFHNHAYES